MRKKFKIKWILDSRKFSILTFNRFLVTFGTQIQAVCVGWLIYQIKKDPLYLGLIGLAEAFPALGLSLFSGWIVDRSRPLVVYRRAILTSALSALILFVLTLDLYPVSETLKLGILFVSAFLTGVARSFISPCQFALLPTTVPRPMLGQATAWNTSLNQVANLSGPALGGFLYASGGERLAFSTIFVLLFAALFSASQIHAKSKLVPEPQTASQLPLLKNFFSGFEFVFKHQIIVASMALDMFGVLFGGATALFPVFASDIFSNGPVGLGILRAAMPIGSFIMGGYLIKVSISRFSGKAMLLGFVGFGLSMIGFALSRSFLLSVFFLFIAGICDSISMVTRQTILQLSTPEKMRGRVAAVSAIFIGSSNEIGAFESGLAAKLMGTRPSVLFGGCMTLLVVAITWVKAPLLRKIQLSKL